MREARLIQKHAERSTSIHPIYLADRVFLPSNHRVELEAIFGHSLTLLDPTARDCLALMVRHGKYSKTKTVTAKTAAFAIWHEKKGGVRNIKQFDTFYRKIRALFNKLEEKGLIRRAESGVRGFVLNEN